MKKDKNILIAFLLNFIFSVFELLGGIFTGSVAITSDALHDFGDALSIGIAYILERKSMHRPDDTYTYGYIRFSVLGSLITTLVLLCASVLVLYGSVKRLIFPAPVNADGMLLIAFLGVIINGAAVYFTHDDTSLNGKAINLHMLEDVLGWISVLIGAAVIRFTDFYFIDPLLSVGVSLFILYHVFRNLCTILNLFLEKIPKNVSAQEIKENILKIDGVLDVHHLHIRSLDGKIHAATIHIVAVGDVPQIKKAVRSELRRQGIEHITLETETEGEICGEIKRD